MEDWELIKNDIIKYFVIDFDNRSRIQKTWFLRALYYALCKKMTNMTLEEIGATLKGGFDHATVINGIKKFHDTIKHYDKEIGRFYEHYRMTESIAVKDVDLKLGYIKF